MSGPTKKEISDLHKANDKLRKEINELQQSLGMATSDPTDTSAALAAENNNLRAVVNNLQAQLGQPSSDPTASGREAYKKEEKRQLKSGSSSTGKEKDAKSNRRRNL